MADDIRAYLEIRTAGPSGWSPDGSKLLISSDLSGTAQLYRLDLAEATAPVTPDGLAQLTQLPDPAGGGYLPTDDRLLVTMDTGGNERHQLYVMPDAVAAPVATADELEPVVVDPDHIHRPGGISRDGRWLAYATNRRNDVDFDVWVRDLGSGQEELVYRPGGWTGAAGMSPDGRVLPVWELTDRPGDNRVHLLDRVTGGSVEMAPHDDGDEAAVGAPAWLPDGSAFFFATDVGRDVSAIARGTPDGAWQYVLEPGWECDCGVDWTGRHLLVVANEHGYTRARLHDPDSLKVTAEVPLPGDGVATTFRFSRDGRRLSYAFTSPLVPGDAWCYDTDTGAASRLTTSPCPVDPATFMAPALARFGSFDDLAVPAFVFRPRAGQPPYPVVVIIHGGPEAQYRPAYNPLTQYLVARGFAVVAPNVRGSTGYGKRYQHLDDVARRLDAVADLAALHDWLAAQPDLDETRAALYGGSYGGYMVLAGLALQPDRWAAGVDVVGISSLITFLENTAPWRRAFREREYGSLEHNRDVLVAASPITHVEAIRAPLFIVHGANDPRVPLGEAEQIHALLGAKGVRTELLVYADEGHGLARLDNRVDAYPRVAAFLEDILT